MYHNNKQLDMCIYTHLKYFYILPIKLVCFITIQNIDFKVNGAYKLESTRELIAKVLIFDFKIAEFTYDVSAMYCIGNK